MPEERSGDLITLAARRGLVDESTARSRHGRDRPTTRSLVAKKIIRKQDAAEILEEYHFQLAEVLHGGSAQHALCGQCGEALTSSGPGLTCAPCGIRIEPRRAPVRQKPAEPLPAEARDPKNRFGKYDKIRQIGRGGFGSVWLALDTELSRHVALKLMHGGEATDLARFKREAQMAARLDHPNIASIYDVGEVDGQHYIALHYVEGETLAKLRLTPREALQAIRDAARGVAHAHRHEVIHRDLKPQNMMRDRDGRIFVLDFGLARSTQPGPSITASEVVLGTPTYMSPEQVTAERVDKRSDVYGLGATLYELVTGRPPFVGESAVNILRQVLDKDPVAPRRLNPSLDADIETIVMKAMEKEPGRRYDSAAALADDIDRALSGEPIAARPASFGYRLIKRVRRDPIRWGLGAAVVAAVVVFGTLLQTQQSAHARRLEAAAVAGEAGLAYLTGDLELAAQRAREATQQAPENALGWYWLGRLKLRTYQKFRPLPGTWRAEGEVTIGLAPNPPPQAQAALEAALSEFRRMTTLGKEGAAGEEEDAAAGIVALFEGNLTEAQRRLRMAHQRRTPDWELQYNLGLALYFDRRFAEAAEAIEPLLSRNLPEPEAVFEAYSRAQAAAGLEEEGRGKDPQPRYQTVLDRSVRYVDQEHIAPAVAAVELARATYLANHGKPEAPDVIDAAIERLGGREDVKGLMALGDAKLARGDWCVAHGKGTEAESAYGEAIKAFSRAAELDEDFAGAPLGVARVRDRLVDFMLRRGRGKEGKALVKKAREELEAVEPINVEWYIRMARLKGYAGPDGVVAGLAGIVEARKKWPRHVGLLLLSAGLHETLGTQDRLRGRDPIPNYTLAREAADQALQVNPNSSEAWNSKGRVHAQWGIYVDGRGEDPTEMYRTAIEEEFAEAIRINPEAVDAWMGRATVRLNWAVHKGARGEDDSELYRAAVEEDLTEAVRLNPESEEAWTARGAARINWAMRVAARGEDPTELYTAAIEEDLENAIRINPESSMAWSKRGLARVHWGNHLRRRGEDPTEQYETAINRDYTKAIELNPTSAEFWLLRGEARSNLSLIVYSRGGDASEILTAAIETDFAEATRLNPEWADAWRMCGNARVNLARVKQRKGEDPTDLYRKAIEEDFATAIRINPKLVHNWMSRGVTRMNFALYMIGRGEDPREVFEAAIDEDFAEAVRLNPKSVDTLESRARCRIALADHAERKGDKGDEHYRAAIEEDLDRVLKLNPKHAYSYMLRGYCRLQLDEPKKALADFEEGVKINPRLEAQFKAQIEVARFGARETDF